MTREGRVLLHCHPAPPALTRSSTDADCSSLNVCCKTCVVKYPPKVCHTSIDMWAQQMQVREEEVRRDSSVERGKQERCSRCWIHPRGVPWKAWLWRGLAGIKRLIVHVGGERGLSTVGNC